MQTISVNKNMDYSAPILFMPSYAKATADAAPLGKTEIKQIQKTYAPAVTKKPVQIPKTTTLTTTQKNKSSDLSAVALREGGAKVKPQEKKQELVKPVEKVEKIAAAVPKKPEIKAEAKKIEPVVEQKKEEVAVKKIEQKTESLPPTPVENKVAKALDIDSPVIEQTPIHNSKQGSPCDASAEALAKEEVERNMELANAQISHNYREVEALRRHAQLQKELVQKWHPPIGVSPDCSCDISFFVNNKGVIENIKMVKSSNVTMFDISARQALFSMKMPQWTYGNPLVISFKQ
jgi:hypothetical protein